MTPDDHACLTSRLSAAVTATDPERALAAPLPATFGQLWDGPLAGVFVTRTGSAGPTWRITGMDFADPVPDAAG